jgi:hypothetical protein
MSLNSIKSIYQIFHNLITNFITLYFSGCFNMTKQEYKYFTDSTICQGDHHCSESSIWSLRNYCCVDEKCCDWFTFSFSKGRFQGFFQNLGHVVKNVSYVNILRLYHFTALFVLFHLLLSTYIHDLRLIPVASKLVEWRVKSNQANERV